MSKEQKELAKQEAKKYTNKLAKKQALILEAKNIKVQESAVKEN